MSHESTRSHYTSSEKTIAVNGITYACPFVDLLPPLHPEEREALKASIEQRGTIAVPIVVDEDNNVIDGHNRLQIAAELQLADVPTKVVTGLSPDERRALALTLNVDRRHLSREQRRELIAQVLMADPTRSNNRIAAETKADHKTVGDVREHLVSTGEIPQLDTTIGKDGKKRRAKRGARRATAPAASQASQSTPAPTSTPTLQSDTAAGEAAAAVSTPALRNWPRLKSHGWALQEIGSDVAKLAKMKKADRTPEAVRKQLDRLRAKLDEMDRSFPAGSAVPAP